MGTITKGRSLTSIVHDQILKRDSPFAGNNNYAILAGVTIQDLRPARPEDFDKFDAARLITWAVAERCWLRDPLLRPTMSEVVKFFEDAKPFMGPFTT